MKDVAKNVGSSGDYDGRSRDRGKETGKETMAGRAHADETITKKKLTREDSMRVFTIDIGLNAATAAPLANPERTPRYQAGTSEDAS